MVSRPFESLIGELDIPMIVFDRDGRIQAASRGARDAFARIRVTVTEDGTINAPAEMIDESGAPLPMENVHPDRVVRSGKALYNQVVGFRMPSGAVYWSVVSLVPLFDPDTSEMSGVLCTYLDVTELRTAQEALHESEQRYRTLAENAADLVYRFELVPPRRFGYMNPAIMRMLGYTPDELYADPGLVLRIVHKDDRRRLVELARHGALDVETVLVRMTHRDGHLVWTEHRLSPLRNASGTVVAFEGIARDVTATKAMEEDLSFQVTHDPLTGLPNRVLLVDRLDRALTRRRRHPGNVAVLYLDVDRFKAVNDNLGHEAGDRLLEVFAQRLNHTVRPSDTVARLAGDEFAAILPDLVDPSEATRIAERIIEAVAEPVDLGGGALVVTMSIGIALADGDGDVSGPELLRRADIAMYRAKDGGRARVECYDTVPPDDRVAAKTS